MTEWASDGRHTSLSQLKMFVIGVMRCFFLLPLMQKHMYQVWGLPVRKTWCMLNLLQAKSWKPCKVFADDISTGRDASSLEKKTYSSAISCVTSEIINLTSAMALQGGGVDNGWCWWSWRRKDLAGRRRHWTMDEQAGWRTVVAELSLLKEGEGIDFLYP